MPITVSFLIVRLTGFAAVFAGAATCAVGGVCRGGVEASGTAPVPINPAAATTTLRPFQRFTTVSISDRSKPRTVRPMGLFPAPPAKRAPQGDSRRHLPVTGSLRSLAGDQGWHARRVAGQSPGPGPADQSMKPVEMVQASRQRRHALIVISLKRGCR